MPHYRTYFLEVKPTRELAYPSPPVDAEGDEATLRGQRQVRLRFKPIQILRGGVNLIVVAAVREF